MKGKVRTKVPGTQSRTHILTGLQGIVEAKWKPTALEQEQMLTHLATCTYCQIHVEIVVAAMLAKSEESDPIHEILIRLKDVFYKRQERVQDITAYTEILEVHGYGEANRRFPALAEHLRQCKQCASEVKELRKALRQAVQAGLIAPLSER